VGAGRPVHTAATTQRAQPRDQSVRNTLFTGCFPCWIFHTCVTFNIPSPCMHASAPHTEGARIRCWLPCQHTVSLHAWECMDYSNPWSYTQLQGHAVYPLNPPPMRRSVAASLLFDYPVRTDPTERACTHALPLSSHLLIQNIPQCQPNVHSQVIIPFGRPRHLNMPPVASPAGPCTHA
jgi:hypothetical protein